MKPSFKRKLLASATSVILIGSLQIPALAGDIDRTQHKGAEVSEEMKHQGKEQHQEQKIKDAWLHGKVEMALAINPHLNPFTIDTSVNKGVVRLTGNVESEIDRDMATEVARSIDDVVDVKNDLKIRSDAKTEKTGKRSTVDQLGTALDDASITTAVKSKLLANSNTQGLKIDVTTKNNRVILAGSVSSEEEKDLAGGIARVDSIPYDTRDGLPSLRAIAPDSGHRNSAALARLLSRRLQR